MTGTTNKRKIEREQAMTQIESLAHQMQAQDWYERVTLRWPAPIAHEIVVLHELMSEKESPASVLLQVRDIYEVLIKLMAALMTAGLASQDANQSAAIHDRIMVRSKSLGRWVDDLKFLADRVNVDPSLPAPIRAIAQALESGLRMSLADFTPIRNDLVGHAANRIDPRETAKAIDGVLHQGEYVRVSGHSQRIEPLFSILSDINQAGWMETLHLIPRFEDGNRGTLIGAETLSAWHTDQNHHPSSHEGKTIPVDLHFADGSLLYLSPYIAARVCSECRYRDLFIFDSVRNNEGDGVFDLLDYGRGHKLRTKGKHSDDLRTALLRARNLADQRDLVPPEPDKDRGSSLSFQTTLDALDSARLDRSYRSPEFIRAGLRAFIEQNSSGIYMVRGPSHTGKTTFVQGICEGLDTSRLSNKKGIHPISFYCRKEHRPKRIAFVESLNKKLEKAFDVSVNLKHNTLSSQEVGKSGKPEAFIAWMTAWRDMLRANGQIGDSDVLLLAIDGLDEAPSPGVDSLLDLLPPHDEVPEQVILLFTSRGLDDPDSPSFLRPLIKRLYPQTVEPS